MTKEEKKMFEDLKKEITELRNEKSIYCDPEWVMQIANFLLSRVKLIGGNVDEAYEDAYEITCRRFNITEEGLRKIHLKMGKDENVDKLKKSRFLKEDIMNRPTRLCPFSSETEVIHMRRDNMHMVDTRYHDKVDYDLHQTTFYPCMKTACMLYDEATGTCKRT